jgi:hypothetical protein
MDVLLPHEEEMGLSLKCHAENRSPVADRRSHY